MEGGELEPFTSITRGSCARIEPVPAEFRFRMCNDNIVSRFEPDFQNNQIVLNGELLNPNGWSTNLKPQQCRSYIVKDSEIDFCKTTRRLSIAMQGFRIDNTGKKFCRCFAKGKSTIDYNATPAPTPTPRGGCSKFDVIISKLVIPSDNSAYGRYLQLYFGPECRNSVFRNTVYLTQWDSGKPNEEIAATTIQYFYVQSEGYANVCTDFANSPKGVTCHTYTKGGRTLEDAEAGKTFALAVKPSDFDVYGTYNVIDIFNTELQAQQCI